MIATSDTELILLDYVRKKFNMEAFIAGTEPKGDVLNERVIVKAKPMRFEKIWKKNFVEVNFCVPDKKNGDAAKIRLQELERLSHSLFNTGVSDVYDGTPYIFSSDTIGIEKDNSLRCHYVNVKILFENLNVNV